jgi:hypothetical protein
VQPDPELLEDARSISEAMRRMIWYPASAAEQLDREIEAETLSGQTEVGELREAPEHAQVISLEISARSWTPTSGGTPGEDLSSGRLVELRRVLVQSVPIRAAFSPILPQPLGSCEWVRSVQAFSEQLTHFLRPCNIKVASGVYHRSQQAHSLCGCSASCALVYYACGPGRSFYPFLPGPRHLGGPGLR